MRIGPSHATTNALLAALEVKLKAPNGVNFTAKGTSAHDGPVTSSVSILLPADQRLRLLIDQTARGKEVALQWYGNISFILPPLGQPSATFSFIARLSVVHVSCSAASRN